MDDAPFMAEGTDSTVEIVGRKLIVRHRGVKKLLQRGLTLYRNPKSLAWVFDSPSKKVITAALAENKDLARVIVGAVKETGTGSTSTDEEISPARALGEALQHNRRAVVEALRANDELVKSWLRDHKDLAGTAAGCSSCRRSTATSSPSPTTLRRRPTFAASAPPWPEAPRHRRSRHSKQRPRPRRGPSRPRRRRPRRRRPRRKRRRARCAPR